MAKKLKYLFEAEYKNRTLFVQPKDDISFQDSLKSSFFDINQVELKKFTLVEDVELGQSQKYFSVDLEDGHFEINGIPFFIHDDRQQHSFRLIFFRKHKHGFNSSDEELFHNITYRLGWQYTEEGKNYQQVIEFN